MASATLTLLNRAGANVVYTLVGQTATGALYKDATRTLALPRTLEFQFTLGNPGSLSSDKLKVIFQDTVQNATSGKMYTLKDVVEITAPRDSAVTETFLQDILSQIASLLSSARIDNIIDGIVP